MKNTDCGVTLDRPRRMKSRGDGSLAQRYRPQTFTEVFGHEKILARIRVMWSTTDHATAFLFSGPTGCGKTSIARIMAVSANCGNGRFGEPCKNCRKKREGNTFDITEINASDVTGIDGIRAEVRAYTYLPMPPSRVRVYILDEAHNLSDHSQNFLLKPFEDGPKSTLFFICTTDPHRIIPTLRRRCAQFHLESLTRPEIEQYVNEVLAREGASFDQEHMRLFVDNLTQRGLDTPGLVLPNIETFIAAGGDPDVVDENQSMYGPSTSIAVQQSVYQSSGTPMTWETIPTFDPAFVAKTEWLVKDFIPARNITLIFGAPGSFKSTYLIYILKRGAGENRVLILDYENPPDVLKQRNEDLKLDLLDSNFKIWERFGPEPPPRPGDARLEQIVKKVVNETGRGPVLLFDSWASLLNSGQGGESTGQIAPIYNHLRRLCDLGATVIILDHTRKYLNNIIYGGEDKQAKADVFHTFLLHEDSARPGEPIVEVESWLKRHAPKGTTKFAFRVRSKKDEDGTWHVLGFEPAENAQIEKLEEQHEIMRELIEKNPGSSQKKLVKLAHPLLSQNKARDVLKSGVKKRYWAYSKSGHGKYIYKVSD